MKDICVQPTKKVFSEEERITYMQELTKEKTITLNTRSFKNENFPPIDTSDELELWKSRLNVLEQLTFEDCCFSGKATFKRHTQNLVFKNCYFFDDVCFEGFTADPFMKFEIENCTFLGKVEFQRLILDRSEKSKFRLYRTTFHNNAVFSRCSLRRAIFFEVSFVDLEPTKSWLHETVFNLVAWPNMNRIVGDRDSFRQTKVALSAQGNHLDANLFHSLEMDAYKDELCKTKFFDRFEDKAVFWLSYMVSKFSQSWLLPLFWFFAIGFGFFFFFDAAYQGLLSGSFCDRFWQFVNPLSDAISDKAAAYKGAYSFWFLHKLISGFIVYHFIVALRRKTRNI